MLVTILARLELRTSPRLRETFGRTLEGEAKGTGFSSPGFMALTLAKLSSRMRICDWTAKILRKLALEMPVERQLFHVLLFMDEQT